MRVMADQIGADIILGDGRGFLGRGACGHQQALGDFHQLFG